MNLKSFSEFVKNIKKESSETEEKALKIIREKSKCDFISNVTLSQTETKRNLIVWVTIEKNHDLIAGELLHIRNQVLWVLREKNLIDGMENTEEVYIHVDWNTHAVYNFRYVVGEGWKACK